jgi:magnesium transporter
MVNVLLQPELRELLEKKEYDVIIDFCTSDHPAEIADFISALTPEEIWQILLLLTPQVRANIFSHINEDLH